MAPFYSIRPQCWDASYLDRLHIRVRKLPPDAVPTHTTASPPPLPPLSDGPDCFHDFGEPGVSKLVSLSEEYLSMQKTEWHPVWRHRRGGRFADCLLKLWFRESDYQPDAADPNYPLQYCYGAPLRLRHRAREAEWTPLATVVARGAPRTALAALVSAGGPRTRRVRPDWAEEVACLVSLAQMRGGGRVLAIAVRNASRVWMLSANFSAAWLGLARRAAPHARLVPETPVDLWGGWDIATEPGRRAFWAALGPALERVVPPPPAPAAECLRELAAGLARAPSPAAKRKRESEDEPGPAAKKHKAEPVVAPSSSAKRLRERGARARSEEAQAGLLLALPVTPSGES